MASILVNKYKMRSGVMSFHLGGMVGLPQPPAWWHVLVLPWHCPEGGGGGGCHPSSRLMTLPCLFCLSQACSNGVLSVQLVRDLLKANPNSNAVVVTTEVLASFECGWAILVCRLVLWQFGPH
jgi:hypothetical protein